jgi:hypothetical protein
MNYTHEDYMKRTRKYLYIFLAFLLFAFLVCGLLVIPAHADEVYGVVHNNTISWSWNNTMINRVSVDGLYVYAFVANSTYYQTTFADKLPLSHNLVIYQWNNDGTGTKIGENISTTTGEPKADTQLTDTLYKYIWLIIGVILIGIGVTIRRSEFCLIAGFIAFIGLGIVGDELIGKIIYALLLIVAFYTSFGEL